MFCELYKSLVIIHKIVSHEYFLNDLQISEVPLITHYIEFSDTTSWIQTRELMLSVLKPYLKKKDTTAKDLFKLPIDDDGVEHDHTVSKGAMDWFKKYKENYNKEKQKES